MDSNTNINAVAVPSRTILLTGVPSELNTEEKLRKHFSKFGVLLCVNEKYGQNSEVAVITFFSIADAIAAFISSEAVLDADTVQKSWFDDAPMQDKCVPINDSIQQNTMLYPNDQSIDYDKLMPNQSHCSVPDQNMNIEPLQFRNENTKTHLEGKAIFSPIQTTKIRLFLFHRKMPPTGKQTTWTDWSACTVWFAAER